MKYHHVGDKPWYYEIKVLGDLDPKWSDWFDGLAISLQGDGSTLLTGPVADQPALYGLLSKIRDLGLPLLSISLVGVEELLSDSPAIK